MHGGQSPGAPLKHGERAQHMVRQRREDRRLLDNLNGLVKDAEARD
jgi:hypothetical protein